MNDLKIQQKQQERAIVLDALYGHYLETNSKLFSREDVAAELKMDVATFDDAFEYLYEEGLGSDEGMGHWVGLSHQGIKEAERLRQGQETQHFARGFINIIHGDVNTYHAVASGDGSQAVAGPNNAAIQNSTVGNVREVFEKLIREAEPNPELATFHVREAEPLLLEIQKSEPNQFTVYDKAKDLAAKPFWRDILVKFATSEAARLAEDPIKHALRSVGVHI